MHPIHGCGVIEDLVASVTRDTIQLVADSLTLDQGEVIDRAKDGSSLRLSRVPRPVQFSSVLSAGRFHRIRFGT